ncbi:hypothetical protein HY642_04770, partial [Candidatus Woesearchaeota archaeon]|nr:hypothetical protein [Candidatus Woesearchaeota archaeon]
GGGGGGEECTDACSVVEQTCKSPTLAYLCGNFDYDSCLEVKTITCPAGTVCSLGECVAPCTENWECDPWTSCLPQNIQVRTCRDLNACGRTLNKPITQQNCTYALEAANLTVEIISIPGSVSVRQPDFSVLVRVRNAGNVALQNIELKPGVSEGWRTQPARIDTLAPGASRDIRFLVTNVICSLPEVKLQAIIGFSVQAVSEKAGGQDSAQLNLDVPRIALLFGRPAYAEGDRIDICILINNAGEPERKDYEVELDVSDEQRTYLADYLTRITAPADGIAVVKKSYPARFLPQVQEYAGHAKLFQRGALFAKEYLTDTDVQPVRLVSPEKPAFIAPIVEATRRMFIPPLLIANPVSVIILWILA